MVGPLQRRRDPADLGGDEVSPWRSRGAGRGGNRLQSKQGAAAAMTARQRKGAGLGARTWRRAGQREELDEALVVDVELDPAWIETTVCSRRW